MQTGLLHLHNILRWVILILLLWSIFKAYSGMKAKKAFDPADKKVWLFTMIAGHITLVLGLYQVLFGRIGWFTHPPLAEGESVMSNKGLRFFLVEHPILMILAIILITMGHGMAKKAVSDEAKYRKAFSYFVFALIAILVAIPWPFREVVGRALFPGM
jgi:hypothetical protein